MILNAKDRPKFGKWFVLSFQHVFAFFSATVLVPILTGLPISVALFTSGVGTLIYILCTKAKVPIYLGSSFAYIGAIVAASTALGGSFASALTALLVVGIIYVIVAIIIKFTDTGWLHKLLPPVVIGPMIMIIGLSLAGSALGQAGLITGEIRNGGWKHILVAFVSMLTVAVLALRAKGFLKVIPFLIGIAVGYVTAAALGIIDFSAVGAIAQDPKQWFRIPEFMFLWFRDSNVDILGSNITFYKLNFAAALSIAPLALVTISEHIGDHIVLGKIVGADYLEDPGLHRTLMGDGVATSFAALVGGPANTSYGENTSVVGITKVASVWVTGGAAVIAIVLSFINIFVALVASIPAAVMGGISIILYGFIASNGLKVMIDSKLNMSKTRNLIIVSVMLIVGIGGAIIDFGKFQFYGMSLAVVLGILLNSFLPQERA